MPNHVSNNLHIVAPSKDREVEILNFLNGYTDEGQAIIDFNRITPKPPWIFNGDSLAAEHMDVWGENNWYDWNISNWGTKWNAYDQMKWNYDILDKEILTISFNTAWSAPTIVLSKLPYVFPDCIFVHMWADEDFGSNTGMAVYSVDSDISCINYYEYDNMGKSVAGFIFGSDREDMEYRMEGLESESEMTSLLAEMDPSNAALLLNAAILDAVTRVPVIDLK